MGKWCVIVVPGAIRRPRNAVRNIVVHNLALAECVPMANAAEDDRTAEIRTLYPEPRYADRAPFEAVDVVEAYWADLMPNDGEAHPARRVFGTLGMVAFWLGDWRSWRAIAHGSPYVVAGYMFSAALLLLWAFSLVVASLEWFGDFIPAASFAWLPDWFTQLGAALGGDAAAEGAGDDRGWILALQITAVTVPLLPVVLVIDLGRLSRDYLRNVMDEDGVGLRAALFKRVRDVFIAATGEDYDRIVLVGHSFGALPLVDLLADWPYPEDLERVRVITLGAPNAAFSFKSPEVRQQVDAALARRPGLGWLDLTLKRDYWSAGLAGAANTTPDGALVRRTIRNNDSHWAGLTGQTHLAYFTEPPFLEGVLSPMGELCAAPSGQEDPA